MPLAGVYNQEILATQGEAVGTVWLIATLGSRSYYKKKDIINISITKVCETISDPTKSLPLRFQSNMLFGIAMCYKHQIDFFYSDTTQIKTRLTKNNLSSSLHTNTYEWKRGIEAVNVINPARILLRDDMNFNIDLGILPKLTLGNVYVSRLQANEEEDIEDFLYLSDNETHNASYHDGYSFGNMMTDLELDFGDLDKRQQSQQQQQKQHNTSHQQQEFSDLGLNFDLGFPLNLPETVVEQEQEQPLGPGPDSEQGQPAKKKQKTKSTLTKIQIDPEISISTQELRRNTQDYIQNQIIAISAKYKTSIEALEPECYSKINLLQLKLEYIDQFYNNDLGFGSGPAIGPGIGVSSVLDEIEQARGRAGGGIGIGIHQHRRSSSNASSIERPRHEMSSIRSRSNSDFFGPDGGNGGPDFDVDFGFDLGLDIPEPDDIATTINATNNIDDIVEKISELKQSDQGIVSIDDICGDANTKTEIVRCFMKLLQCASLNYCTLFNDTTNDNKVMIRVKEI